MSCLYGSKHSDSAFKQVLLLWLLIVNKSSLMCYLIPFPAGTQGPHLCSKMPHLCIQGHKYHSQLLSAGTWSHLTVIKGLQFEWHHLISRHDYIYLAAAFVWNRNQGQTASLEKLGLGTWLRDSVATALCQSWDMNQWPSDHMHWATQCGSGGTKTDDGGGSWTVW